MLWRTEYIYIPRYEYVSTNQHGDRYKRTEMERINVAKLSLDAGSVGQYELKQLILIGHHLDTPVRYQFGNPHTISIEVVSGEVIRKLFG